MQEIVPVGVLAENPQQSLNFYRKIMKIQRVQLLSSNASGEFSGALLRLESPQIEVNSTQTRIVDRKKSFRQTFQRLKYWCEDIDTLKEKLLQIKLPVFETSGRFSFLDPNGINWDICPIAAWKLT